MNDLKVLQGAMDTIIRQQNVINNLSILVGVLFIFFIAALLFAAYWIVAIKHLIDRNIQIIEGYNVLLDKLCTTNNEN